jgi:large subunit ribosomal protein L1
LAKVARHLGPKGLMPNPKNSTISTEPEKVAKKFMGGEINWKTEAEFPLIHHRMGKMSFKDKQLEENYKAFIKSVNPLKIKIVTIKSTMSPGIKVKFA